MAVGCSAEIVSIIRGSRLGPQIARSSLPPEDFQFIADVSLREERRGYVLNSKSIAVRFEGEFLSLNFKL